MHDEARPAGRSWPRFARRRFDPPTVAQLHLTQFRRYGEPPQKCDHLSAIGRVHYWTVRSPHLLIAVWNSSNHGDQMSPRASDRRSTMRSGHEVLGHSGILNSVLSVRVGFGGRRGGRWFADMDDPRGTMPADIAM